MVATLKDVGNMQVKDPRRNEPPKHVGKKNTALAKKLMRGYRLPKESSEGDTEFGPEVEGIHTVGFGAKGR